MTKPPVTGPPLSRARVVWEASLLSYPGAAQALEKILALAERRGNDVATSRRLILDCLRVISASTPKRRGTWLERANIHMTPKRLKGLSARIKALADEIEALNRTPVFHPDELDASGLLQGEFMRLPVILRAYAEAVGARAGLAASQSAKASRTPRLDVIMHLSRSIHQATGKHLDADVCALAQAANPELRLDADWVRKLRVKNRQ